MIKQTIAVIGNLVGYCYCTDAGRCSYEKKLVYCGWPKITSKYIVIKRLWNEAIYLYTLCLYYSKQSSGITEEKEMADKGNTTNLEV